ILHTISTTTTTSTNTNNNTNTNDNDPDQDPAPIPAPEIIERVEKQILEYIYQCTLHIKNMYQGRIEFAKAEMEEYNAFKQFKQVATPAQWNTHLMLQSKIKLCLIKNTNYRITTKRLEYDILPKFIEKINISYKIDESIMDDEAIQTSSDEMRQITKDYRTRAMALYVQVLAREYELVSNDIKRIIQGFPQDNNKAVANESGHAAFTHYHDLREKRLNLEVKQSIHFVEIQQMETNLTTTI
ncbi:unnamed protein product, partial [Rotaria magnacalcarata]